jgi:hypothetical protein
MTSVPLPMGPAPSGASGATLLQTLRPLFRPRGSSVSTLLAREDRRPAWLPGVIAQLESMGESAEFVDEPALRRSVQFLAGVPEAMPEPVVAIGDDGSVGAEWEYAAGHLYLTFSQAADEVYWCSADGREWEDLLARSIPRLVDAIFELLADRS